MSRNDENETGNQRRTWRRTCLFAAFITMSHASFIAHVPQVLLPHLHAARVTARNLCRHPTVLSFHVRRVTHRGSKDTFSQAATEGNEQVKPLIQGLAAGLAILQTLSDNLPVGKDLVTKITHYQAAKTPCKPRWQQLGRGTRIPFLRSAQCSNGVHGEVVGKARGLFDTRHEPQQRLLSSAAPQQLRVPHKRACAVEQPSDTTSSRQRAGARHMVVSSQGPVVYGASSALTASLPLAAAAGHFRLPSSSD